MQPQGCGESWQGRHRGNTKAETTEGLAPATRPPTGRARSQPRNHPTNSGLGIPEAQIPRARHTADGFATPTGSEPANRHWLLDQRTGPTPETGGEAGTPHTSRVTALRPREREAATGPGCGAQAWPPPLLPFPELHWRQRQVVALCPGQAERLPELCCGVPKGDRRQRPPRTPPLDGPGLEQLAVSCDVHHPCYVSASPDGTSTGATRAKHRRESGKEHPTNPRRSGGRKPLGRAPIAPGRGGRGVREGVPCSMGVPHPTHTPPTPGRPSWGECACPEVPPPHGACLFVRVVRPTPHSKAETMYRQG